MLVVTGVIVHALESSIGVCSTGGGSGVIMLPCTLGVGVRGGCCRLQRSGPGVQPVCQIS